MTRSILIIFLTSLVLAGCSPTLSTIQRPERPGQALVLIDLQRGVLSPDGPATLGAKRSDALIQATNRAIDTALKNGIPIAFVKNEWSEWRFFENWWFGGAFRKVHHGNKILVVHFAQIVVIVQHGVLQEIGGH